jgi:hypothetical protein
LTTSTLARTTDPITSHEAVPADDTRATQMYALLRAYTDAFPRAIIRDEAAQTARLDLYAASKRISDLQNKGLIAPVLAANDEYVTATAPSGRQARVLKATGAGLLVTSAADLG